MVNPVGPTGSGSPSAGGKAGEVPPGIPLPANNPWVKNLAVLFPGVPLGEIQMYAAKFQENMFQALNNEIQRDLKKAREAAKKFKESIDE